MYGNYLFVNNLWRWRASRCIATVFCGLAMLSSCATPISTSSCSIFQNLQGNNLTDRAIVVAIADCETPRLLTLAQGDTNAGDKSKRKIQNKAVDRLPDESQLHRIAKSDVGRLVAEHAVSRITSPAMLFDIALLSSDEYVSVKAVMAIDQPSMLNSVALESVFPLAKRTARLKLEGGERAIRAEIEKGELDVKVRNSDWYFWIKLVSGIRSEEILQQLAGNVEDPMAYRLRALGRVNDQRFLEKVATGYASEGMRSLAASRLKNVNLLMKIAITDASDKVSERAIKQIKDQRILASIIESSNSIRQICRAFSNLYDLDLLTKFANRGGYRGDVARFLSLVRGDEMVSVYRDQQLVCNQKFITEVTKRQRGRNLGPSVYRQGFDVVEIYEKKVDVPDHDTFSMTFKYDDGHPNYTKGVSSPTWEHPDKIDNLLTQPTPPEFLGKLYRSLAENERVPKHIREEARNARRALYERNSGYALKTPVE